MVERGLAVDHVERVVGEGQALADGADELDLRRRLVAGHLRHAEHVRRRVDRPRVPSIRGQPDELLGGARAYV